ncbi:MAG: hypothetical protein ACXAC5_04590 [Promethearchaeota archaeon]|jgi:hypothetical protein
MVDATFGYSEPEEIEEEIDRDKLLYVLMDDDGIVIDWYETAEEAIEAAEDEGQDEAADRELYVCKTVAIVSRKVVTETTHV